MAEKDIQISVVVAAYNEEAFIGKNLERIADALSQRPGLSWEIIAVNDGSTDNTGPAMDAFCKKTPMARVAHHNRNYGQGRALRTAFSICRGQVVVTLDADLSYGPEYIHLLYDALIKESVDIVLASPYARGGSVANVPYYRRFLSRYGNRYLAMMSPYPVSTLTCVVRAYRRQVVESLVLTSDGSEIMIEIMTKAPLMGFAVYEVPADLKWPSHKTMGKGFVRVSSMRILRSMRLYLLMGWLSRPALVFIISALPMLLAGLYMGGVILYRLITMISGHMDQGIVLAVSSGLKELFVTHTYSVVFAGAFLIIGFQVFAYGLLFLQNKLYFEELYLMALAREKKNPAVCHPDQTREDSPGE